MTAVLLYGLKDACERKGYPLVSHPSIVSPWYTLCACPSCKPASDALIKRWEEKGKVEQFTIRARNAQEAFQEGRRLSIWSKAL